MAFIRLVADPNMRMLGAIEFVAVTIDFPSPHSSKKLQSLMRMMYSRGAINKVPDTSDGGVKEKLGLLYTASNSALLVAS
jgi:hypothetical protein